MNWRAGLRIDAVLNEDGTALVAAALVEPPAVLPPEPIGTGQKPERELTQWMKEIWEKEGKPNGSAFFKSLKKYVHAKGSPITQHYTTDNDGAGIGWQTSKANGSMKKKSIQTMVSVFKKRGNA